MNYDINGMQSIVISFSSLLQLMHFVDLGPVSLYIQMHLIEPPQIFYVSNIQQLGGL